MGCYAAGVVETLPPPQPVGRRRHPATLYTCDTGDPHAQRFGHHPTHTTTTTTTRDYQGKALRPAATTGPS